MTLVPNKRLTLFEPFRPWAGVALDALVTCAVFPAADREILLRVAIAWDQHCHRSPRRRVKWGRPFTLLRPEWRLARRQTSSSRADLYCRFCGTLLEQNVYLERFARVADLFDVLKSRSLRNYHAIECALKHLTFGYGTTGAGVKRLAEEFYEEPAT